MIISGKIPIAMFDILGFRSLVISADPSKYTEILTNLRVMARGATPIEDYVDGMFFSDTIVLFGKGTNTILETAMVAVAASNLMGIAARWKIPIRGALSFGNMHIDTNMNYIVGAPMIKAFDLEKQQEWMGAVVDKEHEKLFESSIKNGPASNCLVWYPAPMKFGPRDKWLCCGWTFRLKTRSILEDMFKDAMQDHETYRKYKNTIDYYDFIEGNGSTV